MHVLWQVAVDYTPAAGNVFVQIDEQVAATRQLFEDAGVTVGPSVLVCVSLGWSCVHASKHTTAFT